MAEIDAYREWLVTGPTDRGVLETIEMAHPAFDQTVRLVQWDYDVVCTVEDGPTPGPQLFHRARFHLEPSETGATTEQGTTIAMSSLDGVIYSELRKLDPQDTMSAPILLTPRMYWTDDTTAQLIKPAPVWELHDVTVGLDAVSGNLQAAPMRVQRTGIYYTALQFPVLRLAR